MPPTEIHGEKLPVAGRAAYGIDAPGVVRTFYILCAAAFVSAWVSVMAADHGIFSWLRYFTWPFFTVGVVFFAQGGVMVWGSLSGKMRLRDKLLASIPWRGDEIVLDVGCGHGLMLIGAAKRLRTGKAIGVDLWQKEDQAGNSREATWRNVEIENVADRVELRDGDARKLPFADNSFDVILSSWALHNIYDAAGRETAIREIIRVLKPGGRVRIVDIRHAKEYARVLRDSKLADVKLSGPNFLFVIPSFTVSATKPPLN
ncbi:MAG TPA: class I SAM-dependent methyltransferase [Verrucomicrobiae bacterium]|nr:class I SAM-dependent methyltransferase [Verrucomicrobiae bacterium]